MLNHKRDNNLIECLDSRGSPDFKHGSDIPPHSSVKAPSLFWRLGADCRNTSPGIFLCSMASEQHGLKSRTNRAHRLMGPPRLFNLDYASKNLFSNRAFQVKRRCGGGSLPGSWFSPGSV